MESINHAKAANIPIIVAINKMDKPDANPERIKQQLTEYELVSSREGLPWSTWPMTTTTGALGRRSSSLSSAVSMSFSCQPG